MCADRLRPTLGSALLGAAAAVCALASPMTVLVLLVALVWIVSVVASLRRPGAAASSPSPELVAARTGGEPAGAATTGDAGPTPPALELLSVPADLLSTDELCMAWRISYWALQRNADTPARVQIVDARESYLVELERRDQQGFQRWLYAGSRAAGNPHRYLETGNGE